MEIQKNMATVLRLLKQENGKSLTEFAKELEISRSALQKYLSGSGNPNLSTIEHLAKKLNIDSTRFTSGDSFTQQSEVPMSVLKLAELLSSFPPSHWKNMARQLSEVADLLQKFAEIFDLDSSEQKKKDC